MRTTFETTARRIPPSLVLVVSLAIVTITAYGQPPVRPPASPPPPDAAISAQDQANRAVQRAYDAIARLASANEIPTDARNLISDSRKQYQLALTAYQAGNFVGARENAMASADLVRAAEQVVTIALQSDASRVGVPAPPQTSTAPDASLQVYNDLARLTQHRHDLNARISASSKAAGSDVRRLINESTHYEQQAQALLARQRPSQAGASARTADALLAAADHLTEPALSGAGRDATPSPPPPAGPEPPDSDARPIPPPRP